MSTTPDHLARLSQLGQLLTTRANAAQSHTGPEGRGIALARVVATADEIATEIERLRAAERVLHLARHQHNQRITS